MNKAILCGRLTRDPEIRYSRTGEKDLAVAKFTLAVNRRNTKNGEETAADFLNCVAFGRTAEFAEKYLYQGIKMLVEGRIQTGSYTDREGRRVYTTDIIVEAMEFAESKRSGKEAQGKPAAAPADAAAPEDGFMHIPDGVDDDELPFH